MKRGSFILWEERNPSHNVTGYWFENIGDFYKFQDEPFVYFEIYPDVMKWNVTLDEVEKFGDASTVMEAIEHILKVLSESGVDVHGLPHYSFSKMREGIIVARNKYILQHFRLDSWLPEETWVMTSTGNTIKICNVDDGMFEVRRKEKGFSPAKFANEYLTELNLEKEGEA